MSRKLAAAWALGLFFAGSSAGWAKTNLILLTVDAVRPDHMGYFGYARDTTPNLDRMAAQGVMFTEAYSLIPLTNPSMSSFLTSLPVEKHGVKRNGQSLSKQFTTLPEVLKTEGYTTAAVMSCWAMHHFRSGQAHRFDYFLDQGVAVDLELPGEVVTERALELLDRDLPGPLFFWVHYSDPHQPHKPFPGFSFAGDGMESNQTIDGYDSEVAYSDHQVGLVLEKLKEKGYLDDALIVIFSDHGEGLGEHGFVGHGRGLYEYILRVPIILSGRLPAGVRVPGRVTHLDLAPTILSLLGVEIPEQMEGQDLTDAIGGEEEVVDQPIFYQTFGAALLDFPGRWLMGKLSRPSIVAVRDGNHKLQYDPQIRRFELYDLEADPQEKSNLAGAKGPEFERLKSMLLGWHKDNYSRLKMLAP